MKVLAYQSKWGKTKALYQDHQGEQVYTDQFSKVMEMLFETQIEKDQPCDPFRVVWDLDQFVAPMFRLMLKEYPAQLESLLKQGKVSFDNLTILYNPQKMMSMKLRTSSGIEQVIYYDISQYYHELVDQPEDIYHLKELAEMLLHALDKMGIRPSKLSSPAKIFEECVLERMFVPTAYDIPEDKREIAKYAYYCTNRPWIECHQIGHWDATFDYDISSAYPFHAMSLLSTKHCKMVKVSGKVPSGADWGYIKGKVTVNPEFKMSPVMKRSINGGLYSPSGSWDEFITLGMYNFIRERCLGDMKIEDGWYIHFDSTLKPFEATIKRMYAYRGTNGLANKLAKRMMVGGIGKFIEHYRHGYGRFFNPMYSAEVETNTAIQLAKFLYEHKVKSNQLIAINTDGCLLSDAVVLKQQKLLNQPGEWKLTEIAPAIALSSGMVIHGSKRPHGVNYHMLKDAIDQHPNNSSYELWIKRMVSIPDLAEQKADVDELGNAKKFISTSVDLFGLQTKKMLGELDRNFEKLPKTGADLLRNKYQSEPIKIGD